MLSVTETISLGEQILKRVKDKVTTSEDIIKTVELPYYDPHYNAIYAMRFGKEKFNLFLQHQQKIEHGRTILCSLATKHLIYSPVSSASIALTEFGVGECQETSTLAVWYLFKKNYKTVCVIMIESPPDLTEISHRIARHIFLLLSPHPDPLTCGDIGQLNYLSDELIILDPLLNTVVPANQFLTQQHAYLNTLKYDKIARVQNFHAISEDFIPLVTENIKFLIDKAKDQGLKLDFNPSELSPTHETVLIHTLNQYSGLLFSWGHQDYLVDAFTPVPDDESFTKAKKIQKQLGYGKFFYHDDQRFFVIKSINKGNTAEQIDEVFAKPRR